MKPPLLLAALLLSALAGCSKKDADANGPGADTNPPILDASSTGWERVGSIPLTAAPGINNANAMTVLDLQLAGSELRVLYRENTQLSGTSAPAIYKATVSAGTAPAITPAITPLPKMVERATTSSTNYANTFFFQPGTFTAYQGLYTASYGALSVATSQVLDENGRAYCTLSGNGGTFQSANPDMQADGSVLYSGGLASSGANGNYWWHWLAYFRDGRWLQAISQGLSQYTPQTTTAFQAVKLPGGKLYGALSTADLAGIADTLAPTYRGGYHSLPMRVSTTFPNYQYGDRLKAKVVGPNKVVFATWSTQNQITRYSAYRWTEGAPALERLYANVELPAMYTTYEPPVLDDDGAVYYLVSVSPTNNGQSSTALLRLDQAGARTITPLVETKARYLFSGLRKLNGQWYAGIGPMFTYTGPGKRYLDLVRLKQ